jgi:very-short-patch-repair endonuclease
MYYIPYNKNLKTFSRKLRNHSTLDEILLWMQLRAGTVKGYTFNRQKPLGNYIVDFYCKPLKLVIEVDGGYHFTPEQRVKDQHRQQILEAMGLQFLRFLDDEVRKDMNLVIRAIEAYIDSFEANDKCQKTTNSMLP